MLLLFLPHIHLSLLPPPIFIFSRTSNNLQIHSFPSLAMTTEIESLSQPHPAAHLHPNRQPAACDRHPDESFIGFCPSCLRERLSNLAAQIAAANSPPKPSSSGRPELSRSKSFSVSRIPGFAAASCEPRRNSCDVRTTDDMVDLKPIKDHIVLDSAKEFAGSFWLAASVFSKRLRKWRTKQKLKKKSPKMEIGNDAFCRRSCESNPRLSLDASRFSFDDPRYSWDEPRASWDGYLIGGSGCRLLLPRLPPMLAVAEDSPAPAVQRFDGLIPVEEELAVPGGSLQTRDYYEMKLPIPGSPTLSAKLVPAYHGGKHERDSREWSSNSLRDECSENIDLSFRQQSKVPPPAKKSRRWSKAWSFLGFIHRRGGSSIPRANGIERSFSEAWPEAGEDEYHRRICRSNSSVSSRSSLNGVESNENGKKKNKRNGSSRYSPSHVDNGLLRFYLPAMRGSKYSSPHSLTGSMLRLY